MRTLPLLAVLSACLLATHAGAKEPAAMPVDWTDKPAREAAAAIGQAAGVPVLVDTKALEAAGVDPALPIDLHARSLRPAEALRLLLRQWNSAGAAAAKPDPLNRVVAENGPGGSIEITTLKAACAKPTRVVLDLREMLIDVPQFDNAPTFNLQSALSNTNTGAGGGGSGGQIFNAGAKETVRKTRAEKAEELAATLRRQLAPGIWREDGADTPCSLTVKPDGTAVIMAPRCVLRGLK